MASFAEYKNAYENNWADLEIRANRLQEARNQANRLLHGKPTYQQIESKTGVPWWFVGLCHYRESNFNFDTYLGNRQSLLYHLRSSRGQRRGLIGLLQLIAGSIPGLSGFTMPLFLVLTAWGALGKIEKWAQGTAPPPTSTK
jgi:hypothetical protein